jgi:hypothetical protein
VRDVGHSSSSLSRRVHSGDFQVLGPHSLAFGGVTLDWRGSLQAGLFDLGPDALVSAEAAAALHGLDGFDEGPLVFLGPRTTRNRRTVGELVTTSTITRLDRVVVDGLPTTSGTRTIVELLGRVDRRRLGNAYDSACRKGLTAPRAVDRRLDELGRQGRGGVTTLRALQLAGDVQSWLERAFLELIEGQGLPQPAVQRVYRRDGVHVARVDFDFAPLPLIVEVGGTRGYLSRDERRRQERRRNELQLLGKTVYFFTTEDVAHDGPYVLATLREALRAA